MFIINYLNNVSGRFEGITQYRFLPYLLIGLVRQRCVWASIPALTTLNVIVLQSSTTNHNVQLKGGGE